MKSFSYFFSFYFVAWQVIGTRPSPSSILNNLFGINSLALIQKVLLNMSQQITWYIFIDLYNSFTYLAAYMTQLQIKNSDESCFVYKSVHPTAQQSMAHMPCSFLVLDLGGPIDIEC